jgi:hypothetical protein
MRSPTSVEAIQRVLREALCNASHILKRENEDDEDRACSTFENSDISYWSEIGTQMYFNPPYDVKAAIGVLPGFH